MMEAIARSSIRDPHDTGSSGSRSPDQSGDEFKDCLSKESLGTLNVFLTQECLEEVMRSNVSPKGKGKPVDGIPHTNPDDEKRAMAVVDPSNGRTERGGHYDFDFSQQSLSKPLIMGLAMQKIGGRAAYHQFVGSEASGRAYNAPDVLPDGRPFNPSNNNGALASWFLLFTQHEDPLGLYMARAKELTGNPNLEINEKMALGEANYVPPNGGLSSNQILMNGLLEKGPLKELIEEQNGGALTDKEKEALKEKVYLSYCRACAVMVNVEDMARAAAVYHNGGVRVDFETGAKTRVFPKEIADDIHRSYTVSGSYNESGTEFVKKNFAGKTGVGGGIFGTLGGKNLVVATLHTDLNPRGNSGEGQKNIATLSRFGGLAFEPKGGLPMPNGTSQFVHLRHGALGPSPRDVDRQLRRQTPDDNLKIVRDQLRSLTGNDKDFYMKSPDETKGKHQLLGARRLLTDKDKNGDWKSYYYVPDGHEKHKVLVTDGVPRFDKPTITPTPRLTDPIPGSRFDLPDVFRGPDDPPQLSVSIPNSSLDWDQ